VTEHKSRQVSLDNGRAIQSAPTTAAVVLAGGSGTRVGVEINKVYLPLAGESVISWSLKAFARVAEIGALVVVIRPEDAELAHRVIQKLDLDVEVVFGGDTRQTSELSALRHLADRIKSGAIDLVLLHDGARPLIDSRLITEVANAARVHGGAVPGLAADDLIEVKAGNGDSALVSSRVFDFTHGDSTPPTTLVRVQTPQGFHAAKLLEAYELAEKNNFSGTDTASCVERFSDLRTQWVTGRRENIKVTYKHDVAIAERLLAIAHTDAADQA
jgi:2-C-methyl-D-erythritol 4-phosphate cytidylyltransferase